jgi:hypothetical protein
VHRFFLFESEFSGEDKRPFLAEVHITFSRRPHELQISDLFTLKKNI